MPTFEVSFTEPFDRCLRKLKRKYRRLREDMEDLALFLEHTPHRGIAIPGYAHKVWKIRWPSRDMAVGKRGGFRAIYSWKKPETTVYLLLVYAKPRKGDVTDEELKKALREAGLTEG